ARITSCRTSWSCRRSKVPRRGARGRPGSGGNPPCVRIRPPSQSVFFGQLAVAVRVVHGIEVDVDAPARRLERADLHLDFVRNAVGAAEGNVLVEDQVELDEVDVSRAAGPQL